MSNSEDTTDLNGADGENSPADVGHLSAQNALALGAQYHNSGNLSQAEGIYRQVLQTDPKQPDALQLLGVIALQRDNNELAVDLLTRSLAIESGFANVHASLGLALKRTGKIDEAIASFDTAITIDPNNVEAHLNLGFLFKDTGNPEAAVESLRAALALDPENRKAAYLLAALTDEMTEAPPEGFVEQIFDEHAFVFERRMQQGDSQLPQICRSAAARFLKQRGIETARPFPNTLDLGCGTGRAGAAFRDTTDTLHGVDLSLKMMEQALEKGVYDGLFQGDFTGFLNQTEDTYDLVLAVDSFLYIGPLEAVFSGVVRVLRPGGSFAFTVEALDSGNFALRDTCHHAHGEDYVRHLAAENHLDVALCEPIDNMRFGTKGTLFWLEKPG
ncbi:MAG: tetratricopeptide repeat protein [Rhodospirillales bacterium]|nr:tetratricopeptide repeat protein [Rhodospirillales bacterium]